MKLKEILRKERGRSILNIACIIFGIFNFINISRISEGKKPL